MPDVCPLVILPIKMTHTSLYESFSGGDGGDRTHDLLTASQTLSQLSYAPVSLFLTFYRHFSELFASLNATLISLFVLFLI